MIFWKVQPYSHRGVSLKWWRVEKLVLVRQNLGFGFCCPEISKIRCGKGSIEPYLPNENHHAKKIARRPAGIVSVFLLHPY